MLSISNLQEACEVLTKKTGRTWTDKMLLDFAQHTRQRLSASTPIDSIPVLYALRDEDGRVCFKEKFRLPPGHRPLLHLFPSQVLFLLIRGEVMAHHVDWGAGRQPEDTMELIEPEARILPKDVRLKRSALDAILQRWQQSQIRPGPISGLKNGKGEVVPGDTHHRWPAWVFDDDPSAEEKTSAEVPDPGHEPDGDPGTIAAASDDRKPTKG